jgi:undecaprenyl-diphosphatase
MTIIEAIILGIVEGFTEFLPISSTGHLIVTEAILDLPQSTSLELFTIVIQLGAIIAILAYAPRRILTSPLLWRAVGIAFIPTAILGFIASKSLKFLHATLWPTALAMLIGGIIILVLERYWKPRHQKTSEQLTTKEAACIGALQVLAAIPGLSRSGTSIYAGLAMGLTRKEAVEFSFFLGLPTIGAASAYSLLKFWQNNASAGVDIVTPILIGTITSAVIAFLTVKWLVRLVENHGFTLFGWYRITAGAVLIVLLLK